MTLPHGFDDPNHSNPRESCPKCNPKTTKRINIDENGDMDCFDRIFELRRQKCNATNCNDKCTHIVKGKLEDEFYCNRHFFNKVRTREIEHHFYFSFRYELAKLLVYLGFVKEKDNA